MPHSAGLLADLLAHMEWADGWKCPITVSLLHAVITEAPDATIAELCGEYTRRAADSAQTTVTSFGRAMPREGYVLRKAAAAERD